MAIVQSAAEVERTSKLQRWGFQRSRSPLPVELPDAWVWTMGFPSGHLVTKRWNLLLQSLQRRWPCEGLCPTCQMSQTCRSSMSRNVCPHCLASHGTDYSAHGFLNSAWGKKWVLAELESQT